MKQFKATYKQTKFIMSDARVACFIGGVGCIGGETLIGSVPVSSLTTAKSPFPVPTMWGWSLAATAFPKGLARLYHVVTDADPRGIWATAEHLFLTPRGWTPLGELLETSSRTFSLACCDISHDRPESETGKDFLAHCLGSLRSSDERSTPLGLDAASKWQQLRKTDDGRKEALALADLLSKSCFSDLVCCLQSCSLDVEHPSSRAFVELLRRLRHILFQSLGLTYQTDTFQQSPFLEEGASEFFFQREDSIRVCEESPALPPVRCGTPEELCTKRDASSNYLQRGLPKVLELLWSYVSLSVLGMQQNQHHYSTRWGHGQVIDERDDIYYDVYVPGVASYIAGGVVNHNSGKTASGAVKATKKINEGKPGIIVAPDFPQFSKSTFPEFLKWAPMSRCTNAHLDHPHTNKKELHFNVKGQDVVVYYGGIDDEQSWAGPNVNWVWFDEGARKRTRKAFDILMARTRIGDSPQVFLTTTPAGTSHWLYDVCVKGIFDDKIVKLLRENGYTKEIVEYVTASTAENQENIDPFQYLFLTGMYSNKLREQELEGQFVSMEGAVWEALDMSDEGRNCSISAEYIPGVPVEWWVDDGFVEGHPRVIFMAQIVPPKIHVFNEYVAIGELAEDSVSAALSAGYPKPSVSYVDSSAAELRSRLWREGIDTVAATHSVEEGIKRTASWICDGDGKSHLVFHPRCAFARKEMPAYYREDKSTKPVKAEDNASDAVRYGLWSKDRDEIWSGKTPDYHAMKRAALQQEQGASEIIVPSGDMTQYIMANPGDTNALLKWYQHKIETANMRQASRRSA